LLPGSLPARKNESRAALWSGTSPAVRQALIIFLALAAGAVGAAVAPIDQLRSISYFAFGGVGVAGTTSQGEVAFRQVLQSPTAKENFLLLLKTGNPQGKCYALAGLRASDRKRFEADVAAFEKDQTPVDTIGGCIAVTLPMSGVVANIRAGHYDLYLQGKDPPPRRP
jgi:hypothetical protein